MKHPSLELFQLIMTLTMNEKRHFKLYAMHNNENSTPRYIQLFDLIDILIKKNKSYNEIELKKKIETKRFDILKQSLFNKIIDSLVVYYQKSEEISLNNALSKAHILQRKGMFDVAAKYIQKYQTKNVNNNHFLHDLGMQIIDSTNHPTGININNIEGNYKEQKRILYQLDNTNEYLYLYSNYIKTYMRKGTNVRSTKDLQEFTNIVDNELLRDYDKATNFTSKSYFNIINSIHSEVSNSGSSHFFCAQQLQLFEDYPTKKKERYLSYILAKINHQIALIKSKKYDEFLDSLKSLQAEKISYSREGMLIELGSIMNHLLYFITIQQYTEAEIIINRINKLEKKYSPFIGLDNKISYTHNIIITYFSLKKYRLAFKWINELLNEGRYKSLRSDIQISIRLINLIIHFELKNEDQLTYYIIGTYRYLAKRKLLYKTEHEILSFLKKALKNNDENILFKELYNKLILLHKDRFESKFINELHIITWLESKIQS